MAFKSPILLLFAAAFWGNSYVSANESDSGDNFTNNLFSDLGPLLALFGERFAQQFLSESFTWSDYILFGMAPLGILTALVSAIRVRGPIWLKALVGRARENLINAEFELMSSVSNEVCELWNGRAIIKSVGGRSKIKGIIHIPDGGDDDIKPESFITLDPVSWSKGKYELHPKVGELPAAYRSKPSKDDLNDDPEHNHTKRDDRKRKHTDVEAVSTDRKETTDESIRAEPWDMPPNISINSHGKIGQFEACLYAGLGSLAQAGVLIYTGVITYDREKRKKLNGQDPEVGFKLQVIGTCLVTLSMIACAWIIGDSTEETEWVGSPSSNKAKRPANVFWVQQKHVIGDQDFESCVLIPNLQHLWMPLRGKTNHCASTPQRARNAKNYCLTTSHRSEKLSSRYSDDSIDGQGLWSDWGRKAITAVAVILGLTGFIIQFESFRLCNWSCSVAQLGAIAFSTVLRAIARRGLVQQPQSRRLPANYELDFVALNIAGNGRVPSAKEDLAPAKMFFLLQGHNQFAVATDKKKSPAQSAMEIRARFGDLLDWPSPQHDAAMVLSNAIDTVLKHLEPNLGESLETYFGTEVVTSFPGTGKPSTIYFKLGKDEVKKPWEVDKLQIEAALSLSSYCQLTSPPESFHRIPGQLEKSLQADCLWWMDWQHFATAASFDSVSRTRGLSYPWKENDDDIYLPSASSQWPLVLHIFYAFMFAISDRIPDTALFNRTECLLVNAPPPAAVENLNFPSLKIDIGSSYHPKMVSKVLNDVTVELGAAGNRLGEAEAQMAILVPLSYADKLPNEVVVNVFREKVLEFEKTGQWGRIFTAYESLIKTACKRAKIDRFTLRVAAVVVDLLIELRELQDTLCEEAMRNWSEEKSTGNNSGDDTLPKLYTGILSLVKTDDIFISAVSLVEGCYRKQKGSNCFREVFEDDWYHPKTPAGCKHQCDIFNSDPFRFENGADALGRTRGFYPAHERGYRTDPSDQPDISGRTVLHYIAEDGGINDRLRGNDPHDELYWAFQDMRLFQSGRNGQTPLHRAAMRGNGEFFRRLPKNIEAIAKMKDHAGRTFPSLAAWYGHESTMERILEQFEWSDGIYHTVDNWKQGALFLAVRNKQLSAVKLLTRTYSLTHIDYEDRWGQTPLRWAAKLGYDAIVEELIKYIYSDTLNKAIQRALCEAAAHGHLHICKLLVGKQRSQQRSQQVAQPDQNLQGDRPWDIGEITPLCWAAKNGHIEVVDFLIDEAKAKIHYPDDSGTIPLHEAAENGHTEVVRHLVDRGANFNQPHRKRFTPLALAMWHRQWETAIFLLKIPGFALNASDKRNNALNPLMLACEAGQTELIQLLLRKGADPKSDGRYNGANALHAAAKGGSVEAAEMVLANAKIEIEATDGPGNTPLVLASRNGHVEFAKFLHRSATQGQVWTSLSKALNNAAEYNQPEVIKILLQDFKADPDADYFGDTPLMVAVRWCHEAVVDLLLAEKVRLDLRDRDGDTALDLARKKGHQSVVDKILRQSKVTDPNRPGESHAESRRDSEDGEAPLDGSSDGRRQVLRD